MSELVGRHVVAPHWSEKYKVMTKVRIDWTAIGKQLDKKPMDCKTKWDLMKAQKMKKGAFAPDEDVYIILALKEWGDKGQGLWVNLQRDLGRSAASIRLRWSRYLSKKKEMLSV